VVLVMDGAGAGAAVDADAYGDSGSDTLGNTARAVGGLRAPVLGALGLGCVAPIVGIPPVARPLAVCGLLRERSAGKDTTTGHWELMGLRTDRPFPVFPEGFPPEVMDAFARATGRGWLGNVPASGTEVIARLGEEHLRTGRLIVYTSADSVFQVAAHTDVVPVAELYGACEAARRILDGPWRVGRVIARPFTGPPGAFTRTAGRRDYAVPPHGPTVLDRLTRGGVRVEGVGKIGQIFAGRGIAGDHHTAGDREGMQTVARLLDDLPRGLVFANLVDFDSRFGHRNDPAGWAECLAAFDEDLGRLIPRLGREDLLLVTADHGNDPTTPSTDHSREWVPLLALRPGRDPGGSRWLGEFADCGRTALEWLLPGDPAPGIAGRPVPLPSRGPRRSPAAAPRGRG
jgi:phosphopentomutase